MDTSTPHAAGAATRSGSWPWRTRSRPVAQASIDLSLRRIYILPTRYGLLFGLVLLLMLTGSVNYSLSLGFVLTFLLASLALVSMLHTYRNVAGLRVSAGRAHPVFEGEVARFAVRVDNADDIARQAIEICVPGHDRASGAISARAGATFEVPYPATRRGVLRPERFVLSTSYPIGLFRAWSNLALDCQCLVYPAPESGDEPLPPEQVDTGEGASGGPGDDDFSGLRAYSPGDSPRRIAWKAHARGGPLLTKQFSGAARAQIWLDLDALPPDLHFERKLARLCRWILDAAACGQGYGLRLGRTVIGPDAGAQHRDRCLDALALIEERTP